MSSSTVMSQDRRSSSSQASNEKQDGFPDIPAEHPEISKAEEITFPEGGARAWAVALGSALAVFSTFGYVNSYGVFQEYYEMHQLKNETPSAISWIGSIQTFFLFAGSLFGGPLFDKYGHRIIWGSAPVFVLSVFLTSVCKEYYQFMLAQGILGGLGMGMTISPAFSATAQYFNKKRGAALGLTVAGSSLGGVVWPIVLSKMFHSSIGFGWSIRICGFVMLALLAISLIGIKSRLPPRNGNFFLLHAFRELPFIAIVAAVFLATLGQFIPVFYLPSYAVMHGMSTEMAFYLVSILNAASFFGRVIPGITADKFGPLNMLCGAALSTGILILCWPETHTNAGIIVFAAVYGFCSGAIVSLMSVSLSRIPKNPDEIGTYMGMGMFIMAFAALAGPPINGALITEYGDFKQASIFSGIMVLAGGFVVILAKKATGKGIFARI